LELTFRQACTAGQRDEVAFLDVNYTTTEMIFTKDVVKPTAAGRQLINGKPQHPNVTFKSILFAEAIRSRRLSQKKVDHPNSLDRL